MILFGSYEVQQMCPALPVLIPNSDVDLGPERRRKNYQRGHEEENVEARLGMSAGVATEPCSCLQQQLLVTSVRLNTHAGL